MSTPSVSAYTESKAVDFASQSGGTKPEACSDIGEGEDLSAIAGGAWVVYKNVDFGPAPPSHFIARVASQMQPMNAEVQVRLDSLTGMPIASFYPVSTGSWQSWMTVSAPVTPVTGKHDIYLTFASDRWGYILNVNWFTFAR